MKRRIILQIVKSMYGHLRHLQVKYLEHIQI